MSEDLWADIAKLALWGAFLLLLDVGWPTDKEEND